MQVQMAYRRACAVGVVRVAFASRSVVSAFVAVLTLQPEAWPSKHIDRIYRTFRKTLK